MANTNGVRIARDDDFLTELAKLDPVIYFQFDGLSSETYQTIRGEDLLELKMLALDRMHQAGLDAVLVAPSNRVSTPSRSALFWSSVSSTLRFAAWWSGQ